jgi:hypothetical protein
MSVSPERTQRESALASLNAGQNRSDAFSNQFSNVWLTPDEMMFRDTTIASDAAARRREAKGLIYRLGKAEEKQRKVFERDTKDALIDYY